MLASSAAARMSQHVAGRRQGPCGVARAGPLPGAMPQAGGGAAACLHADLGATLRLVGVPPVSIFPLAAPQCEESALRGRLFARALLQAWRDGVYIHSEEAGPHAAISIQGGRVHGSSPTTSRAPSEVPCCPFSSRMAWCPCWLPALSWDVKDRSGSDAPPFK